MQGLEKLYYRFRHTGICGIILYQNLLFERPRLQVPGKGTVNQIPYRTLPVNYGSVLNAVFENTAQVFRIPHNVEQIIFMWRAWEHISAVNDRNSKPVDGIQTSQHMSLWNRLRSLY